MGEHFPHKWTANAKPRLAPDPDSLFFGGLNLGNGGFDRLESLFGEVGIEFARFCYISNELLEERLGIFGLNLNGVLKRLCAKQLFEESGTVLERLFRILARFSGDCLRALAEFLEIIK